MTTTKTIRCDGCNRRKSCTIVPDARNPLFVGTVLCDPCLLKVAKTASGLRALDKVVDGFADGVYYALKYGAEG